MLALMGMQSVAGTNYCFLCQTIGDAFALVYVYRDLSGNTVLTGVEALDIAPTGTQQAEDVAILPNMDVSPAEKPETPEYTQLCLVQYTKGTSALFSFLEWESGEWVERFSCTARVGRKGIDKTKEGDYKTPTGTFALKQAFGIKTDPGTALPYHQVTKDDYWCSTASSSYYNQLVSKADGYKPTSKDEHLINIKPNYNYCLVIDYNSDCISGKGSAIFLSCYGSKKYTSGCVAIPEEYMIRLLQSLQEGAMIRIEHTAE